MDAIETLMHEHRLIEQVLDALVGFADEVRRKGTTEKEELGKFVGFIRDFADACHHGKEEDILFTAMVECGFPREGGPIAVMLNEHGQGRAWVRALAAKAEQPADWSDQDRQDLANAAYGYSNLLHAHIHKEDAVLYPMAEQHLPAVVLAEVGRRCERFEAEKTGAGEHDRLHAVADALVARYGPPAGRAPAPARFGSCC
ncbi:MAG TPA: hemerythrin domain-containing protein [Anaeromyxobacteraceae bacterium]|nr:hemerythrin domain-containing protein [Anaeromyxobacteraceae bacterium]